MLPARMLLALVAVGLAVAAAEPPCANELWARAQDITLPDGSAPSKIVYVEATEYAGGSMRTYARLSGPCDPPVAVGIEMSRSLQDNLPTHDQVKLQPPAECLTDPMLHTCFPPSEPFYLPFFEEEAPEWNPFPTLEVAWTPRGHEPQSVYAVPHFDLHFFMINKTESEAITVGGPCMGLSLEVFEKAEKPVPEACFPGDGFANVGASVPLMGSHLFQLTAPEFQSAEGDGYGAEAWNSTWIWGQYDGEINFFEVMVKRSYYKEAPTGCHPIPGLPSEFARAGYRPSTYCFVSTENSTMTELRDFKWYDAGCQGTTYAPGSYLALPDTAMPLPTECAALVPLLPGTTIASAPTAPPADPEPAAAEEAQAAIETKAPPNDATPAIPTGGAFTKEQVALHATEADCWAIIAGKVFDLTDWIPLHPGGPDIIKSLAGTDGTAMFTGMHGSVDADTVMARTLRGFMIGTAEAM